MKHQLKNRLLRQAMLPEIGFLGNDKLQKSKVLIVGMGGLGCPAAQYLAAAGVGHLGLMDFDVVEESNLHRQILYGEDQIGMPKVEAAAERLKLNNSEINYELYSDKLNNENAESIFKEYHLILDGTDQIGTRYCINDTCRKLDLPWIFGSINKFSGQWAIMDYQNLGTDYRSLFPIPPDPASVNTCEANGTLGPIPGIVGTFQAMEAIKYLLNLTKNDHKLHTFDMLSNELYSVNFK